MIKKICFLILFSVFSVSSFKAQVLALDEVLSWPRVNADLVNEHLIKKGWEQHGYEINSDSGFVRRTWMIKNNYNDLKSYFQYYQSNADSIENYVIYQFSYRDAFNSFKGDLKKAGYKLQKEKKKKKSKKEKNKYKDKEELYLSDKKSSLVSVKEVFLLGFNTFLITSYNSKSRVAKNILEEEK